MATPVWKPKEQRWIIDTTIDGERRKFTSNKPGNAGALACKKRFNAAKSGEDDRCNKRLDKVWPDYLEHVKAIAGEANYLQRHSYGVNYILKLKGHKKMCDITKGDWQDIITKAKPVKKKTTKESLSKKSLANLRSTIINFCIWAHDHEIIETVPEGLRLPTDAPQIGKRILSPDDLKRLFEPSTEWLIHSWRFMLAVGLRPGECYGIQKADIKDGVLTIRRSINSLGKITQGKNKNARRSIMLSGFAQEILAAQKAQLSRKKFATHWMFPDDEGQQVNTVHAQYWFTKLMGDGLTPYCLRHTFVSLTKNALPEAMLKQIVGHSKDMDTLGVYGKKISGEQEEAAKIVDVEFRKWIN